MGWREIAVAPDQAGATAFFGGAKRVAVTYALAAITMNSTLKSGVANLASPAARAGQ